MKRRIIQLQVGPVSVKYPQFIRLSHFRKWNGKRQRVFTLDVEGIPSIKEAVIADIEHHFDHICWCFHDEGNNTSLVELTKHEETRESELSEALNSFQRVLVIGSPEIHARRKEMILKFMRPTYAPWSREESVHEEKYPGVYIVLDENSFSMNASVCHKTLIVYKPEQSEKENLSRIREEIAQQIALHVDE